MYVAMPFPGMRPENIDRSLKIDKGMPDSVDLSYQPQLLQLENFNFSYIPISEASKFHLISANISREWEVNTLSAQTQH